MAVLDLPYSVLASRFQLLDVPLLNLYGTAGRRPGPLQRRVIQI